MKERQTEAKTYFVPGIHCDHCKDAVVRELEGVSGVRTADVDLETKLVIVLGDLLDETALVEAIDVAGCDAELISA
jgi:copper chaperone